ncbi:MAG: Hsp20/alpha crystallin family protein [Anaerolineae bacterium]|nr:Hsp20/alpha crystallin family protein [Anaerolineae bacterium]
MANKVGDEEHANRFEREGEAQPSRIVWHQIVVRHSSVWHPPTDVYRTDDRLVVVIEIAGMREEDFEIVLQGRQLVVGGVRQQLARHEDTIAYHQMEIERGAFRTVIQLPWNVDRKKVSAGYRDGLLKIELPRLEGTQIRVINLPEEDLNET